MPMVNNNYYNTQRGTPQDPKTVFKLFVVAVVDNFVAVVSDPGVSVVVSDFVPVAEASLILL